MKVKRRVLKEAAASLLAVFLLLSLGLASVFAQTETGQITVRATDSNGAAVAGASVTVKAPGTGAERAVKPGPTINDFSSLSGHSAVSGCLHFSKQQQLCSYGLYGRNQQSRRPVR